LLARAGAAQRQGRASSEVEAYCRQALSAAPDDVAPHHALGSLLLARGEAAAALPLLERAVTLDPAHAGARINLGSAYRRLGRLDRSMAETGFARALAPGAAEAHFNLANTRDEQAKAVPGAIDTAPVDLAEIEAGYRTALALRPDYPKALYHLALHLIGRGEGAAALPIIERACALDPAQAALHGARAIALRIADRFALADAAYRRALALDPAAWGTLYNYGNLRLASADPEGALAWYARAIAFRPDDPEYHWNRSLALLTAGRFAEGWRAYEWRWRWPGFSEAPRDFTQPAWDGGALDGRTILLHAEQGLGDTIQFIRYARLVKERAARVVVECQPELIRLLAGVAGIDHLVARGAALPDFDVHAPLLSLPRLFGTDVATIPAPSAYLDAPAMLDLPPFPSLRPPGLRPPGLRPPGLKIGIVWAGNPKHGKDRQRSVALDRLAPLAELDGARLYSLQVGPRAAELGTSALAGRIADLSERLDDFADAAGAIAALDLVITVDTAIAHLAGALGAEVWTLLPFAPDWRWLLGRDDSPWYPSMRLFRQAAPGDWDGVIRRVATALAQRLASRGRAG
jgi:Flp pilus assembly protein TadD